MCGIVGILGISNKDRVSMFEDMLHMDALRGFDSTGVAFINRKDVSVVKDTVLPTELIASDAYDKAMKRQRFCLIGHNRAATKGAVTVANAHPFQREHITLVHNGTLHTQWQMPDGASFDSDSECIANSIAKCGIEDTWPVLNGAATLVYWDDVEHSLNIISNGKRPMSLCATEGYGSLLFASEPWMISSAAMRNSVKLENGMYKLDDDTLYTFKLDLKKGVFNYEKRQLKGYVAGNRIKGCNWKAEDKPAPVYHGESTGAWEHWTGQRRGVPGGSSNLPMVLDNVNGPGRNDFRELADKLNETAVLEDEHGPLFVSKEEIAERHRHSNVVNLDQARSPKSGMVERVEKESHERLADLDELDLEIINKKFFCLEWFLENFRSCVSCREPLTSDDYKTARCIDEHTAVCASCQMDVARDCGIHPSQIRMQ